jgi:hypothetical protein
LNENPVGRCPNCGNQVSENDFFCSSCGKALIENQYQERDLLSFGPWGISICFSRPGLFIVTQQNNTRITLTDRRIYGVASFSGTLRFEVPYRAVIFSENINFLLFKVLYVQYGEAERVKEVSIMGNPANYGNIAQASALLIRK